MRERVLVCPLFAASSYEGTVAEFLISFGRAPVLLYGNEFIYSFLRFQLDAKTRFFLFFCFSKPFDFSFCVSEGGLFFLFFFLNLARLQLWKCIIRCFFFLENVIFSRVLLIYREEVSSKASLFIKIFVFTLCFLALICLQKFLIIYIIFYFFFT